MCSFLLDYDGNKVLLIRYTEPKTIPHVLIGLFSYALKRI